jgi:ABC-2 type transport system permease protein
MVNAFRYGFLGVSDVDITTAFVVIVAFISGLFAVAYRLIDKGVGIRH